MRIKGFSVRHYLEGVFKGNPKVETHGRASNVEHILVIKGKQV